MLSGPAAGVLGAQWTGGLVGPQAADHASTWAAPATDIGLVTEAGVHEASARDTQIAGYPILVPMFDLQTIGAGGGSIARVDEAGAFVVGPQQRRAPTRDPPATASAAPSRRSPTRTWCSAGSTPSASSAAR